MSKLMTNEDLEYGDVVLNFGDTIFDKKPASKTARDHVLRLLAYLLFANRVGLPTRHIIQSDGLFTLVEWMPELLVDGFIFPDIPEGLSSIVENAREAKYRTTGDAIARAAFLDEKSLYIHAFDAQGMMARFREQMLKDLSSRGALHILLRAELASKGNKISRDLAQKISALPPSRHDVLLEAMNSVAPKKAHKLIEQWSAVRYYTTPMDFDICIRDLPHEAAALMLRAEASQSTHLQDPEIGNVVPEPMRSAIEVMSLEFPDVFSEGDAKALVEAVLRTRQEVPEARSKFAAIVHVAFEDELAKEINSRLRSNLVRERLVRTNSPTLSEAFKHTIKETGWGIALDFAAGPLSPLTGGIRAAAAEVAAHADMRERAPWKVSCEYLYYAHEKSRLRAELESAQSSPR